MRGLDETDNNLPDSRSCRGAICEQTNRIVTPTERDIAFQTIASAYDLKPTDLEMVLDTVTRTAKNRLTWFRLFRVASSNLSHSVEVHFRAGCVTSTGVQTSLESLDRLIGDLKEAE